MRLRNVKNKKEILDGSSFLSLDPLYNRGAWGKYFGNGNPIYIEIGMGKGDFIIENAIRYPDINFIGIEKYDSVIARAIQKVEPYKGTLNNLAFVRIDAKNIEQLFDKEIDRIYLNFSDPWPKKRHAERRLSSSTFLKRYDSIFKNDGEIIFKTDNIELFAFSLECLSKMGYIFEKVSLDLHNSDVSNNVMSEYEKKFSSMGQKINYLVARKLSKK